jgi:hypothetical protein
VITSFYEGKQQDLDDYGHEPNKAKYKKKESGENEAQQAEVHKKTILPEPIKSKGERLIVTEYGLAHWIAQGFNLDVNDLPKQRPDHITKEAFDSLRGKILKDYIVWHKD